MHSSNHHFLLFSIFFTALVVAGCSSSPPAPVIDRMPASKSNEKNQTTQEKQPSSEIAKSDDWRPDTYTVKKGDTLYSIGLEFGDDYKEIAALNQIPAPYQIKIGQVLKLKTKSITAVDASAEDVTTIPLGQDETLISPKTLETTPSSSAPVLQGPKATREPYSDEALNKVAIATPPAKPVTPTITTNTPEPTKPVEENKASVKPAADSKSDPKADVLAKYEQTGSVEWAWPHPGKVINGFNEATNKGIDIGGTIGQGVQAAAAGKVIYSGSDLRGYGKLVIIKHNALYLSVYAHNSTILVKEGQVVTRGQKIAEMGNSESANVKLHFEIRRQGRSVDPKLYLPQS